MELPIFTKEQWATASAPERETFLQKLFIKRRTEKDPWVCDGTELPEHSIELEQYQRALLAYYRIRGIPHYELSKEEKRKELKKLLAFDHITLYKDDKIAPPTMHTLGLAWSYFPHMWKVRCNNMMTSAEVFNDDIHFLKAIKKRMKLGTYISDGGIRKAIRSYSGVQSPSNFRPSAAAAIYHHFLPMEGGVTWDMSSGFGGRLLGAMACSRVKKYIGTDPSTPTMAGLRAMTTELLPWLPELKPDRPPLEVSLNQCGSEDFQPVPESIDLCFTSPPYFDCEKYIDEPTQSYIKFPSKNQWLHGFMKQTLDRCHKALKPDGHLVLNIAAVKSYPQLVEDVQGRAEYCGFEMVAMGGYSLYRMMGTRNRLDTKGNKIREDFKMEPLLIFRKTNAPTIVDTFQPAQETII